MRTLFIWTVLEKLLPAVLSKSTNTTSATGLFLNTTSQGTHFTSAATWPSTEDENSGDISTTTSGLGDFIAAGVGMSSLYGVSVNDNSSSEAYTASIGASGTLIPPLPTATNISSAISGSANGNHQSQPAPSTSLKASMRGNSGVDSGGQGAGKDNSSLKPTAPGSTRFGIANAIVSTNATVNSTGFIPDNPNPYPTAPPITYNVSFTLSGDCWNQWSQFWSAEDLATEYALYRSSFTSTYVTTESDQWMSTSTVLSFYTTTVSAGQFAITTYSTTGPVTDFAWFGTPTTTYTTTETDYSLIEMSVRPNASLPTPSCILPPIVSQCQASWDDYLVVRTAALPYPTDGPPECNAFATTMIPISCHAPLSTWSSMRSSFQARDVRPKCFQAKVSDDFCSSTRSQYIHKAEGKSRQSDGVPVVTWKETVIGNTTTMSAGWDPEMTIGGPGCTLGCGSCAMQGGTVELIFWPPPITTTVNGSLTHTKSNAGTPVTVEALGTTFTSPTVSVRTLFPSLRSPAPDVFVGLYIFRRALGTGQLQQILQDNL